MLPVLDVRRTSEHQMLKQVREAGAARRLVGRSHPVPEVDCHTRSHRIGVHDNPQAVVQPRVVHQVLQAMDAHRGGWGPCSKSKHAVHVNPPRTGPDGRALGPRPASEQTPTSSPPTERVNVQQGGTSQACSTHPRSRDASVVLLETTPDGPAAKSKTPSPTIGRPGGHS